MNLNTLLDPLAVALLVVTAVLFPWSGVWEYRRLVRWNASELPDARVRHYNWIAAWEWVSVAVFLSWWFSTGRRAATLGLVLDPSGWQWLAITVGVVLSALLVLQMISITRSPELLSVVRGKLGVLADMVPRSEREQRAFTRLSVTAGVCEEILYRGLVLTILTEAIGTWPAVLVSSAVFGLGHIYQGPLGFVRTTAVGLALALLTVFSGSLLTAIVVHVVMDVTSGRTMGTAIRLPADSASAEVGREQ
ncbi:MAG: CPBP family intramembrane metalloprotease [Thermoanaerobaculia bacterium]|nr:MAG: CPBP family intramembrane metalloprotease [Thermoanaerobaculia bacterium]